MKGLKKNFWRYCRGGWPVYLLTLVVGGFFWRVWLRGEIPLPGDFIVGVYYPWLDYKWGWVTGVPIKNPITSDVVSLIFPEQMLAVGLMKKGMWPLWNSYILAGTPLMANLQSAAFSLTNLLYLAFEELTAWSLQIMLQHWLAGVGMYALMRHWKVSKTGSLFGAVAFSFAGFNTIFSEWNGHALSAAFIPFAILLLDKYLKERRRKEGVFLSLVLTGQFLAGYPQTCLYTALALGLYLLVEGWGLMRRRVKAYMGLAGFALVTIGLTSFQLWPAVELWRLSQRGREVVPLEWAFIPWQKLVTIVAPDYFGNHATQNYWGPQNYVSNTLYAGVICLMMALLGIGLMRKRREVRYLVFLVIGTLFFCLPTPWAILIWKKGILGMQSAYQDRIAVIFNFALAGIAGFGIDRYWKERKVGLKWVMTVTITIFVLMARVLLMRIAITKSGEVESGLVRGIDIYRVAARNLVLPLLLASAASGLLLTGRRGRQAKKAVVVVLLILLVGELYRFWWKYTPFSTRDYVFPKTPVIEYLLEQEGPFRVTGREVLPDNLRIFYQIESLEGYETIHPLRISELVASINNPGGVNFKVSRYVLVDNDTHPALEMANVRYYLTLKRNRRGEPDEEGGVPERFLNERFVKVFEDKSVVIFESRRAMARAVMIYDWEVEDNEVEILKMLGKREFPYSEKIIVKEAVHLNKVAEGGVSNQVKYLDYNEMKSVLAVETEKEGLLFISQGYYPGWKAWVDGRETKILQANYAFCAIEVPAGRYRVELSYLPKSFKGGVAASLISLGVLGVVLVGKGKGIKIYLKEGNGEK